jgi:class 3 adenylate cyclase
MVTAHDPATAGREAAERRSWAEAYELLRAADADGALDPEDLLLLGEISLWANHGEEAIGYLERTYLAFLEAGRPLRAAYVATRLAHQYSVQLQTSVAQGWMSRGKRILDEEPESPEHGYWAVEQALRTLGANELDESIALSKEAEEIGRRHGDRSLEIRGLQRRGIALIARGDVAEGKLLLDEAGAAAVGGELDPYSTVVVYCNTISACRDVADFDRACEWTDLAHNFCPSSFPGLCRVNYAEVMKFKGRLTEAEDEAGRAGEELRSWSPRVAGAAFYELGEIRMLLGDYAAAEQSFRDADEFGRTPEPGLSLLRLAQGNAKAASASIARALADSSQPPARRARLLPAGIEIALATGDLDRADELTHELDAIADTFETSALKATAAYARGGVHEVRGETAEAFACFREARRLWDATGATYDVARTRERLGVLARAEHDEEAALWELQAAAARFERLGAIRDAERVADLLRVPALEVTKTFLFTDIVRSTELLETIGDRNWANALRRHDDTLRAIFSDYGGQVVDHTGDGFFVAFDSMGDAVQAAIGVQQAIDQEFVFDVRIGIHVDGALKHGETYRGRGVHTAARVGAAAQGREILATKASVDGLSVSLSEPRAIDLKGIKDPVEVVSVNWRS